MHKKVISSTEAALKCRILGVHITANKQELKQARNRLARLYHPDKNNDLSEQEKNIASQKFQIIQEAYEYLHANHEQIQKVFKHLFDFSLTSKCPTTSKSHWVYTSVSSL